MSDPSSWSQRVSGCAPERGTRASTVIDGPVEGIPSDRLAFLRPASLFGGASNDNIDVFCGGGGATQFVIDEVAYLVP